MTAADRQHEPERRSGARPPQRQLVAERVAHVGDQGRRRAIERRPHAQTTRETQIGGDGGERHGREQKSISTFEREVNSRAVLRLTSS